MLFKLNLVLRRLRICKVILADGIDDSPDGTNSRLNILIVYEASFGCEKEIFVLQVFL